MRTTFSLIFILLIPAILGNKPFAASPCNPDQCLLPDCKCFSTDPPGGIELAQIPQFVYFTFDDAVNTANYEYYSQAFFNRTNPDGCDVSTTYFMSHEYTDYSKVHDLYVNGQEIALHSITHTTSTDYWLNLTVEDLTHEFGDEKIIISTFAKIPEESIKGMRVPFLVLSGSNSFQAAKDINLAYDCSWPTQTYMRPGLWPYTLDYSSSQDCPVGRCPVDSIPGMWVAPMIDWVDLDGVVCSMVDGCTHIPDNDADILQWYKDNFNRNYLGNKAPFGFFVHASWFITNPSLFPAYLQFVDYLQTLPDVYLVSVNRAIEWMKNPVPIGSAEWPACPEIQDLGCNPLSCELDKEGEIRYMTVCTDTCPAVFPWLNNPLGQA